MKNCELDRLIAEHIFGWSDFWSDGQYMMGYPPNEQKLGVGYDERSEVPNYSTDLCHAWLVMEKFEYHSIEKDAGHYYCTLSNGGPFYQGDADTPQLAICLAALKSKGIEIT